MEYRIAMYGPRGLPPAVLKRLEAATEQTLRNADVASRFASQGAGVRYLDSAAMTKYEQDEVAKWGEMVRTVGVYVD